MKNNSTDGSKPTIFSLLEGFETYEWDKPLLKKLALNTFKAKNRQKVFVGEYKYVKSNVKVWVTGFPAQFWEFEISNPRHRDPIIISTGSGSFINYWPFVEKILQGMIVIKNLEGD